MNNARQLISREIIEYAEKKRRGNYATLDVSPLNTVFPTLMKIAFFAGSYLEEIHKNNFFTNLINKDIPRLRNGSIGQKLEALALEIELNVYTLSLKREAMERENTYEYADGNILFSDTFLRKLKNTVDYDGAWFSGLVGFCKCVTRSNSLHFDFFKKFEERLME
jgi:hypothetical protein